MLLFKWGCGVGGHEGMLLGFQTSSQCLRPSSIVTCSGGGWGRNFRVCLSRCSPAPTVACSDVCPSVHLRARSWWPCSSGVWGALRRVGLSRAEQQGTRRHPPGSRLLACAVGTSTSRSGSQPLRTWGLFRPPMAVAFWGALCQIPLLRKAPSVGRSDPGPRPPTPHSCQARLAGGPSLFHHCGLRECPVSWLHLKAQGGSGLHCDWPLCPCLSLVRQGLCLLVFLPPHSGGSAGCDCHLAWRKSPY